MSKPVIIEGYEKFQAIIESMKADGDYDYKMRFMLTFSSNEWNNSYLLLEDGKLGARPDTQNLLSDGQIVIICNADKTYYIGWTQFADARKFWFVTYNGNSMLSEQNYKKAITFFYKTPIVALSSTGKEYTQAFISTTQGLQEIDGFF